MILVSPFFVPPVRRNLDHGNHRRVLNATAHDRATTVRRARRSVQLHTLPLPYLPFALALALALAFTLPFPRLAVLSSAPLYAPTCTRMRVRSSLA